MNIDKFISMMESVKKQIQDKPSPIFRTMIYMGECFRNLGLPVKHMGKISITVNENFWEDEEKARYSIKIFCEILAEVKKHMDEEFGEDGMQIFVDSMRTMTFNFDG